jgi:hypothetical protein
MMWIAIGLAVVLVMLIAVYRVSLKEIRGLKNHLVVILLFEDIYAVQRKDLLEFVRVTQAKNAYDLYHKASLKASARKQCFQNI